MSKTYIIVKLLIVCVFIGTGILLAFKGTCNESLNGIIAGIALIQAFIIADHEWNIWVKKYG